MSRKVLALIEKGSGLEEICQRIDNRHTFLKKKLEQLDKQKEEAVKLCQKECEADWNDIKEITKERMPEDFSDEKYGMTISLGEGAIYCEEHNHGIPPFIKMLMGRD